VHRRVPARIGNTSRNQSHCERGAENQFDVAARWQEIDWLLWMNEEAGADQRSDQEQF
jgi:hypothetical protein